jgi:pimeloyl-ACP methyl ester carboxylesterase
LKRTFERLLPLALGKYFNLLAAVAPRIAAHKAYLLFSTPRSGRVLTIQEGYLQAAAYERITVEDLEIQTYHWKGEGRKVLLLHGWESNTHRWRNLIGFLKEARYEIFAFDAPAQGYSSGKILNVIRYATCTRSVVARYKPDFIIGHSMGGMTAIYHQYLYPQNSLKKIVTIGSPSDLQDLMLQYQKILKFNDRVLEALDVYIKDRFGFGIRDFSTATYARELEIPGLLIHDELDTIAPYRASEKVHRNWKGSKLVGTKGFGHSMHQDVVSEQVLDFLNS